MHRRVEQPLSDTRAMNHGHIRHIILRRRFWNCWVCSLLTIPYVGCELTYLRSCKKKKKRVDSQDIYSKHEEGKKAIHFISKRSLHLIGNLLEEDDNTLQDFFAPEGPSGAVFTAFLLNEVG